MFSAIFIPEFLGTMFLILFGCGVVANVTLEKSKGSGAGTFTIYFGWGLAVYIGVYVAYKSGGYLNPAVVIAKMCAGAGEFAAGISVSFSHMLIYFTAEVLGAIVGAALCWIVYKKHYDTTKDPDVILGTFATSPAIKAPLYNFLCEVIGTFALCFWVLISGKTANVLVGPLAVALIIVGIGACLGGPTGYAINPARDLGPRILHAIAPIKHKGSSHWDYVWIPIVAPMVGGAIAGILAKLLA